MEPGTIPGGGTEPVGSELITEPENGPDPGGGTKPDWPGVVTGFEYVPVL